MTQIFSVRTVRFTSGERFPVLIDLVRGGPILDTTVYTVSVLRSKNRATNTIEATLRALAIFYLFIEKENIDFESRLRSGVALDFGEIDALLRLCRKSMKELYRYYEERKIPLQSTIHVASFERVRMKQSKGDNVSDVLSPSTRIRYIRDYLAWLIDSCSLKFFSNEKTRVAAYQLSKKITESINARLSSSKNRNTVGSREGLSAEALKHLSLVIEPTSILNPWHHSFTRKRNQLAITWLLDLGVRRGELLGLEIQDINFSNLTVEIRRNADSDNDPRRRQPLAKTLDRILPISERLAKMTEEYITLFRSQNRAGLTHGFLFVASGTGQPLSLIGLNKIFEVLRVKCPSLPGNLVPHILRHSTNDMLSENFDRLKICENEEKEIRSQMMGWKPTSNTAVIYTKRHVRDKARKVSLSMQNKVFQKGEAVE